MLYLGIDLGTSSVKVVLLDRTGQAVSRARSEYAVSTPSPGAAESNPQEWLDAVADATRQVVAGRDPQEIVSVGLSGQMHGLVLCDEHGTPLRPAVLWADTRSTRALAAYRALGEPLLRRLGNPISAGMMGSSLAWLAGEESATLAAARWALSPKDWLRFRLTGEVHTEPTDASATLLWNFETDAWDTDVASELSIPTRLLAPIQPSLARAGSISREAADLTGIGAGTPVGGGLADVVAGCLGTGLPDDGQIQLTVGTGAQLVTRLSQRPAGVGTVNVVRDAGPQAWIALAATLNAGLAMDWVRTVLGATWQELYAAAEIRDRRERPMFLPHLVGERTPYLSTDLRGAWIDLALGTTRRDLLHAALEGVALSIRGALHQLPPSGRPIRLAGGGTRDGHWRQLLADVLGHDLVQIDAADASARGAAAAGAIAAGALSADEARALMARPSGSAVQPEGDDYTDRFRLFRDRVESLRRAP